MSRILPSNTALTQNDCGEFLRNLKYINFPLSQIVSTNGIVKYQIKENTHFSTAWLIEDTKPFYTVIHNHSMMNMINSEKDWLYHYPFPFACFLVYLERRVSCLVYDQNQQFKDVSIHSL